MPPSITQLSYYLSYPKRVVSLESTSSGLEPPDGPIMFNISGRSCLAVVCHVLKLCSNSKQDDHLVLIDTIRRLNDLALLHRGQYREMDPDMNEILVNCFLPNAQKFFNVPNLPDEFFERSSTSIATRHEILVDFIHFLLQVLYCEKDLWQTLLFGPSPKLLQVNDRRSLWDELTYLVTYLGDLPIQETELHEEVNNNLLEDFQVIANDAGSFIYSTLFVSPRPIYDCSESILEKIEILNGKIVKHCKNFLMMFKSVTPTSTFVDSLSIIDSLLEDLNFKHFVFHDIKDQIQALQQVLMSTRYFLKAVNMPQNTEFDDLKEYLIRIRDLGYEAEYLIDSFVVGNLPDWYLNLRLPDIIHKFEIIATGYDELKRIYAVNVLGVHEDSTAQVPESHALEGSMADDIVVGFDMETIRILDSLTGGSRNQQIISILGMPGLGKTTLAKKLYNHPLVTDHFHVRAWCVVSQTYNKRKVLIDLLMSLPSKPDKETLLDMSDRRLAIEMQHSLTLLEKDYQSLGTKSHQTLTGRRYLIVLDDVWSSEVWDDLRRYFPDNENGSRIVFTSQMRDIVPSNSITLELPLLSEDQCWKLLEKKVFLLESCPLQLVDTGRQIAAKCSGLPLAVVVIAGVLMNMNKEESVWNKVNESLDLHMSNCMKILELSYKHLPDHLKLCFLYLGVFPEDTEVPVKKLLQLWISEGFIGKQEENQQDVAQCYLMELIDRSLVIIAKNKSIGGIKACSVHHLLRDMCLRKIHEENFLKHVTDDRFSTYNKYHRLCVTSAALGYLRPFSLHCRSFLGHLSDPSSCLPQMKLLRVLELSQNNEVNTFCGLTGINHLLYLRHLVVDQIPSEETLAGLINLEFLSIDSKLLDLHVVPSSVLRIRKLKHLHVNLRYPVLFKTQRYDPETNNLETLSFISIYSNEDYKILRASPHLRKLKCSCMYPFPDLQFLTKLESLKVDMWLREQNKPTEIYFPLTIKKLSLIGTRLHWVRMPTIGKLPNLQVLKLLKNAFEGEEWETTSQGGFQELTFLKLDSLNLKTWNASSEHLPKVRHLVLHKCEELQTIPTELGETLEMMEVRLCSYEASIFAVQMEQEQLENGNEELKVIITNDWWSKEELVQKYREER